MTIKSLTELSYIIRRQLKNISNNKNKIYNNDKSLSLIKNIIPEVNNYSGEDWELYKYLINLHEHRFQLKYFKNKKEKYRFHYLHNNFYIEKKNSNYIRLQLPLTEKDDLFNMFLIKWLPNSYTAPHIHSLGGCILKPLEGELKEYIYDYNFEKIDKNIITTKKRKNNITNEINNNNIKSNNCIINKNIITMNYIDNSIGSHTIYNNINKPSYSLHIYGKNILETILQNHSNSKNNTEIYKISNNKKNENEKIKNDKNNKIKREHSIIKFFPLKI